MNNKSASSRHRPPRAAMSQRMNKATAEKKRRTIPVLSVTHRARSDRALSSAGDCSAAPPSPSADRVAFALSSWLDGPVCPLIAWSQNHLSGSTCLCLPNNPNVDSQPQKSSLLRSFPHNVLFAHLSPAHGAFPLNRFVSNLRATGTCFPSFISASSR